MKKESYVTNQEKLSKRAIEIEHCKRAAKKLSKIPGKYIYCPETRTEVFVPKGADKDKVLFRHKKFFFKQRYSAAHNRIPITD